MTPEQGPERPGMASTHPAVAEHPGAADGGPPVDEGLLRAAASDRAGLSSSGMEFSGRRIVALISLSILLAVAMNWPLAMHMDSRIAAAEPPLSLQDPMYQAWEVAWEGHALLHNPASFYDANIFWPAHLTLAFTDSAPGLAPAGLIGTGRKAAIVRYNVLFLFSYAIAFLGAAILAAELGAGWLGALVAGAAFAYAPWRLAQHGHLNILFTGGIPLSLALLLRGWRQSRPGLILAGWLVAAWQLSLGFAIGLQFAYLMAVVMVGAAVSWLVRWRKRRVGRRMGAAWLLGAAVFAAAGILLSFPYYRVAMRFPEVGRQLQEQAASTSPPPARGFLVASSRSLAWGGATRSFRGRVPSAEEDALFPGITVIGLTLLGLVSPRSSWRARLALGLAVVITGVLCLGFGLFHGALGFRFLWRHAPGWRSIRTPGRLYTLTTLALALLAGIGAGFLATRTPPRAGLARTIMRASLAMLLVAGVLFEGAGHGAFPAVPSAPASLAAIPGPQVDLPTTPALDARYQFWSVDSFTPLVNGYSRFWPCFNGRLFAEIRQFPDHRSVALLEQVGIASVVLHTDLAPGTIWQDVSLRPIAGLDIHREQAGALVVYRLPVHVGDRRPIGGTGGLFTRCPPAG